MTIVQRLSGFCLKLHHYRAVIWAMAKRDLAVRYVGTAGGIFWAIFHPLLTVLIYWFVFAIGFKAQGPAGMPFILYFVSGLVPWLFFSEVLLTSINAVTANAPLIKKTVFPSEILPLVHFISASFTHLVLVLILILLAFGYGYSPRLISIQLLYYYGAMGCLLLGLSWLLGALQVFHRDLGQAMTAVLNLWFWLTPIVWSLQMLPARYVGLFELNPVCYVTEGYRSLLTGIPFWSNWRAAVWFWGITTPVFLAGSYVFRKLKPDFPDML